MTDARVKGFGKPQVVLSFFLFFMMPSILQEVLMPISFGSLFSLMLLYWGQAALFSYTKYSKLTTALFSFSFVSLTALLLLRWVDSGHFPLSNLYESLLFLSWSFLGIQLVAQLTLLSAVSEPAITKPSKRPKVAKNKTANQSSALVMAIQKLPELKLCFSCRGQSFAHSQNQSEALVVARLTERSSNKTEGFVLSDLWSLRRFCKGYPNFYEAKPSYCPRAIAHPATKPLTKAFTKPAELKRTANQNEALVMGIQNRRQGFAFVRQKNQSEALVVARLTEQNSVKRSLRRFCERDNQTEPLTKANRAITTDNKIEAGLNHEQNLRFCYRWLWRGFVRGSGRLWLWLYKVKVLRLTERSSVKRSVRAWAGEPYFGLPEQKLRFCYGVVNAALRKRRAGNQAKPDFALRKVGALSLAPPKRVFISSQRQLLHLLGVITSPLALLTYGFAFLNLPREMQKATALVPALQSNWLMMHVTIMILSYAALLCGSIFSMVFLLLTTLNSSPPSLQMVTFSSRSLPLPKVTTGKFIEEKKTPYLSLAERLDNYSYRVLALGFPLLTIGILSGAVWANEAWGSYWSWDPKETWALITWLVFAIYLHARILKGWTGQKPAIIATFGFFVVWFCYLGVNLLGTGLHSYGWFSN